ncbi:C-terminal binding protein [Neomoorella humiferrea]|uniref:C-terminal binding protein n=1 Tax=Neomoorella humiferrea TaxID=676965 RepID=UPI003D8CBDAF
MYKVLITGSNLPYKEEEVKIFEGVAEVIIAEPVDRNELLELVKEVDAILTDTTKIDKELLSTATKLRVICEYGIGTDNIDVEAATQLGILVCNVPNAYIREVAEHAIALTLILLRDIHRASYDVMQRCIWDFNRYQPKRIVNQVMGLIGLGKIGREVASLACKLGMQVIGYDPYITSPIDGVELVSFEKVLRSSNILSIHVPLTSETKHLISHKEFLLMQDGVIIINVSRGGIIDEKALFEQIQKGKVGGAGLDVLEVEPITSDHPFRKCERIIITPHMAWKSEQSVRLLELTAAKQVRDVLLGKPPLYPVNSVFKG